MPSSAAGRRSPWARRSPAKLRGNRNVSVAFGGDGSSNQGTVFEAMNLAVVLKAPTIFVFENNGYGEHTGASYAVGSGDIAGRARGFGMAAEWVDGADFFAVYEAMGRAVERAKRGEGPSTIEATITRYLRTLRGRPAALSRQGRSGPSARDRWIA